MSYRNKTYVIFDGDEDGNYYRLMCAWKSNENMDFNFYDAHDIGAISDTNPDETVKKKLRERMASAKQVVVLVGLPPKVVPVVMLVPACPRPWGPGSA